MNTQGAAGTLEQELEAIVRREWPEADDGVVWMAVGRALSSARSVVAHRTAPGGIDPDCRCANPHHCKGEPIEGLPVFGPPHPARAREAARQIARAAAARMQENRQAQTAGTANALGIKPPEGWSARYDGDW